MSILTIAAIVFAIAAIGGLVLAKNLFSDKLPPWIISLVHAALGATGLVLLIFAVFQGNTASRLTAALGILIVAALGGFFLASFHIRKVIAPKSIVIIHAGVAVVGFLTLLSLVLGM